MSDAFDNEVSEDAYVWALTWHKITVAKQGAMWVWECHCGKASNGFFSSIPRAQTAGRSHQDAERRKRYKAEMARRAEE